MYSKRLFLTDRLRVTPISYLQSVYDLSRHWPVTPVGTEHQLVMSGIISPSRARVASAHTWDVRITAIPEKLS